MMVKQKFYRETAYSLLEMAIVLVIIGLLTGGIVMGQQLVQNAKIEKLMKDLNIHRNAILMFRDKYQYFPGDMPNAATTFNDPGCTAPTCNGNGDERINTNNEMFRVWQHLNLAGFTNKPFGNTGVAASELPKASIDQGYFAVQTDTAYGVTKNFLELGAISNNANPQVPVSVLTPIDASSIDAKLDDGNATTGNLFAVTGLQSGTFAAQAANSCAAQAFTGNQYNTANYNQTVCMIMYALE